MISLEMREERKSYLFQSKWKRWREKRIQKLCVFKKENDITWEQILCRHIIKYIHIHIKYKKI